MIIIEGPDNSGKSTLARGLSKELGWPRYHPTRFKKYITDPGECQLEAFNFGYNQLIPRRQILDRCFAVGECVYGELIRTENKLGDLASRLLVTLANTQHLIIYCRPPESYIKASTKPEMEGVMENMDEIIRTYDAIMGGLEKTGAFIIRYDFSKEGDFHRVMSNARRHQELFELNEEIINGLADYF